MRPEKYFLTIMVLSTLVVSTSSTSREPSVMSVFAGTTPCGRIIRPLHKIRRDVDCAMVEWKLILYRDIDGVRPTTYRLISVSRYIEETNLYSEPGTRSEVEGTWTITRGTKTPRDVTIYRLNDEMTGMSIDFLRLSDDLLHLLDDDKNLMIGDAFFSYTLNRIANE